MSNLNPKTTPKSLGYRMPAEWEPQTAIWLSWPYNEDTFGSFIEEVQEIFVQFIQALHKGQRICLLVNTPSLMEKAKQKLQDNHKIGRAHV